ncbi:uncharacterized protein LOC111709042 [Eurytemora carolleeae]|uniref:uncharacterized protein LOC111709042 n=1 Tax=Eurytemora carolleeae TaxID=1294199 RepID=UPI000C76A271|nr:uncharacterized protein LOC111709042 [Eurytemora carolleeae]|eukprot:XP_023338391.1 uncharacterized protein LOC111709042 [Eurytemora affinis]
MFELASTHSESNGANLHWRSDLQTKCRNAEAHRRNSEKLRDDLQRLVQETEERFQETIHQTLLQIQDRIHDLEKRRVDLQVELNLHEIKDVELLELGREMRRFLIALETPVQVNRRNRRDREQRWWPDSVQDELDVQLSTEWDVLTTVQRELKSLFLQVTHQLSSCELARRSLTVNLNCTKKNIEINKQILEQRSDLNSENYSDLFLPWSSENIIHNSERIRDECSGLEEEGKSSLLRAKEKVLYIWSQTNRLFEEQVRELLKDKEGIQKRKREVENEMFEMERVISQIDSAVNNLYNPIKFARSGVRVGGGRYLSSSYSSYSSFLHQDALQQMSGP